MSDKQLHSKLIRLAHANPNLRGDLLPLLIKMAGKFEDFVEGKTFTNPETKNKVKFDSLPEKAQAGIRKQFQKAQEGGDAKKEESKAKGMAYRLWQNTRRLPDAKHELEMQERIDTRIGDIMEEVKKGIPSKKDLFGDDRATHQKKDTQLLNLMGSLRDSVRSTGGTWEHRQKHDALISEIVSAYDKRDQNLLGGKLKQLRDRIRQDAEKKKGEIKQLETETETLEKKLKERGLGVGRGGRLEEAPKGEKPKAEPAEEKSKKASLRNQLIRLAHANLKLRADILPLLSRTAANKKYSVIKPIKWKDGSVTEVGEVVEVTYKFANPKVAYLQVGGTTKVIGIPKLSLYLKGYPKMPNMAALRRMEENGIATTPSGHRVELDGQGPDGSPSWWLVLGAI